MQAAKQPRLHASKLVHSSASAYADPCKPRVHCTVMVWLVPSLVQCGSAQQPPAHICSETIATLRPAIPNSKGNHKSVLRQCSCTCVHAPKSTKSARLLRSVHGRRHLHMSLAHNKAPAQARRLQLAEHLARAQGTGTMMLPCA
jgi:hypothetical protein